MMVGKMKAEIKANLRLSHDNDGSDTPEALPQAANLPKYHKRIRQIKYFTYYYSL
jgi:hypothetical protein